MALVTSATDITVIILDNKEANALADLLSVTWADNKTLDELANAMIGVDYE
jgi:hypothetical protein